MDEASPLTQHTPSVYRSVTPHKRHDLFGASGPFFEPPRACSSVVRVSLALPVGSSAPLRRTRIFPIWQQGGPDPVRRTWRTSRDRSAGRFGVGGWFWPGWAAEKVDWKESGTKRREKKAELCFLEEIEVKFSFLRDPAQVWGNSSQP